MAWPFGLGNLLGFGRKDAVAPPVNASPAELINPAYALFLQPQDLTPRQAWLLYMNVSTFAKVVDLIADAVAGLEIIPKINGQAADDNGAFRAFMDEPGFNRDRRMLIKELTVQLLVTGTAFPCIYGNVKFTPTSIDVLKSFYVTPVVGPDMWPASYIYAEGTRTNRFEKQGARDFRWIDSMGMAEIISIRDMDGDRRGIGLSRLSAIKADVELRLSGIQHNQALMNNGARPSGALVFKERLNKEAKEAVAEKIKATAVGAGNAGKVMLFSGGEAEFIEMSQSMKDMDWANLVKVVDNAISARFNVPITLFETGAQTQNNYEVAWTQFYDNAVLPTFNVVWGGLARMFSSRLPFKLDIAHDTLTNNTLARQASARARDLRTAGLITTNEARALVGYEPVLGGDALLAPAGEVPIGEDFYTATDADGRPLRNPPEPKKITDESGQRGDKAFHYDRQHGRLVVLS